MIMGNNLFEFDILFSFSIPLSLQPYLSAV